MKDDGSNKGKRHRREIVECAGIALVNRGRIYLIRPLFNGFVQQPAIPKGHVEEGETPQEAAVREFREETGNDLSGKPLEFLCYVFAKIDDNTDKKVIVYRVDGDGDELFHGANKAPNGEPEAVEGRYFYFKDALDAITVYQQPIVKKLMEQESVSSFKKFIKSFNWKF